MQVLGKKYRFFQKKVPIVSKDTKKYISLRTLYYSMKS